MERRLLASEQVAPAIQHDLQSDRLFRGIAPNSTTTDCPSRHRALTVLLQHSKPAGIRQYAPNAAQVHLLVSGRSMPLIRRFHTTP